ncbi:glycoside hydrolase family protein [Chryseobacterium taklimakanense]|uniref:hypothetical protein n=1 Tax=Chryseobacterium taklimakanense TaxID=536441 RepID=UPI00162252BD|nr:hypothetical protein [Chryseobacterium taklimakanense]
MTNPLFKSYFMGGFECADHINRTGQRVNLLKETQHDIRAEEDYILLKNLGILTVREGICWSAVEQYPGVYDFSEVGKRMKAAQKHGVQQIWDLIHFGYPDALYPTHPHFADRFENLCRAFTKFYLENSADPLFVVPVNEISFLSWFSGDDRGTVPFAVNSGWDMKYHLCKAAIQGIKAMKEELPDCKIVMVEPLIKIHSDGEADEDLFRKNEYQYEAMDIIGGRMCPELGGDESFLEILGFNYYWNCQWRGNANSLCWPDNNNERIPLSDLLTAAYERYKKPIFLSETGHFGEGRVPWLEEISEQCRIVLKNGIDFQGICIYPVTDRPDWDDLSAYSQCGLYDLDIHGNRIPHQESIACLQKEISILNQHPHLFNLKKEDYEITKNKNRHHFQLL